MILSTANARMVRMTAIALGALMTVGLVFLQLSWAQPAKPLSPGTIDGFVQGADGKPETAVVRLQQYTLGETARKVVANAQGKFRAADLPFGRYWLTIRGELAADVEITSAQPTATATLRASPWSTLRGTVREKETGKALAGALVVMNLLTSWPISDRFTPLGDRHEWSQFTIPQLIKYAGDLPHALTDKDGRYEMKLGDEYGTVFAIPADKKLFAESQKLPQRVRGTSEMDFALEPAERFYIRGRVTLADGKPFGRGKAKFYTRRDPDRVYDLTTDDQGNYAFLPTYWVGNTAWLKVAGFAAMHQYVPFDKGPSYPRVDWILKPPQSGKVIVKILQPDGMTPAADGYRVLCMRDNDPQPDAPPPGAPGPHIYYRWEADNWVREGETLAAKNGKVELDLEPGTYDLSLALAPVTTPAKLASFAVTSYLSRDASVPIKITVDPAKTKEVVVTQPKGSALTVNVTNDKGDPIAGIKLAAFHWNPQQQQYSGTWGLTATDDKGQVLFDPLLPGQYVFHPATGGSDFEPLKRYAVTLAAGEHRQLKMVMTQDDLGLLKKFSDQDRTQVSGQVVLQGRAAIHGKVTDKSAQSPADLRIAALTQPSMSEPRSEGDFYGRGSFSLATPVRPDGTFSLYGVAPGKHYLCLYRQGRLQISGVHPIEIQEGEERKGINLVVEPERVGLEIYFKRADGKPIPESFVGRLYTDFGAVACSGLDTENAATSSRNPVPAGRYYLWLDPADGKRSLEMLPCLIERNLQIQPGKGVQKLELTVPTAGAVQGRVVIPDGSPAAALQVVVHVDGMANEGFFTVPLALLRDAKGPPSYATAWIDPEGGFTLCGLAPGRYRLAVHRRRGGEPLFVSEPVDVEGGRITQVGTWKTAAAGVSPRQRPRENQALFRMFSRF